MTFKVLSLLFQFGSVALVGVSASIQDHVAHGSRILQTLSLSSLFDKPLCSAAAALSLPCDFREEDAQANLYKQDDSPVDFDKLINSLDEGYQEILGHSPLRFQTRDDESIDYTKRKQSHQRGQFRETRKGLIYPFSVVNNFIGTGATSNPGNVFPGASVPFGMAKLGIDVGELGWEF